MRAPGSAGQGKNREEDGARFEKEGVTSKGSKKKPPSSRKKGKEGFNPLKIHGQCRKQEQQEGKRTEKASSQRSIERISQKKHLVRNEEEKHNAIDEIDASLHGESTKEANVKKVTHLIDKRERGRSHSGRVVIPKAFRHEKPEDLEKRLKKGCLSVEVSRWIEPRIQQ